MKIKLGSWEWTGDGEGLGFFLFVMALVVGFFTMGIIHALRGSTP